ncbi:tRNA-specific adenosine deaminase [Thiosulfatimonas sediminis]|uniref:tRNA-specific adenosine deaminase n=1 Tax=Thiosulfatimonas sediminis TaxID=2675054 RepID=A0A6F8PXP1_9GAMM|nr:nucleoside deaminase [Thiosulfatimonas sediminis]BBP46913.1 tRNA-specific adenosine deaminase [Thiosulfatimonas sediminis]
MAKIEQSLEQAHYWLQMAVDLSVKAVTQDRGGPFGAVLVCNNEWVASGQNQVLELNDPTAHAEMQAIRAASQKLARFDLSDCVLYSSCQPCPMCLSAIYWARIPRLVYANSSEQVQAIGFDDAWIAENLGKSLALQPIQSQRIPLETATEALQLWQQKTPKRQY